MRRLKLQFPYIGQHSQAVDYSLLLIGLLSLVLVIYQFTTSAKEVDVWETRVARFEQQQQQREVTPRRSSRQSQRNITQEIRQEIRKASVVIEQMNLPWESFFDAIEF
ncbi:MAG: fimbrial assembly protein, partial [Nitrosomonas sp.]|nr:fimbrial assembly protein [Nitrosomonas sp.]